MAGAFIACNQIEVSGDVHAPTAYYPAKYTIVPTEYEAVWITVLV
jgi:hypothetical protein